ncbi:hypothetical protein VNI00_014733 [Paramarasmius palmivorus]|uniref:C2H2-type domain-containing protein n=1 Tax=Paramarasmius palmivorus TaxID=297713 RepID=A0AAW0BRX7_9AGAR
MAPHWNFRKPRLPANAAVGRIEEYDPKAATLQRYQRNLKRHILAGKIMTFNPQHKQWERPYFQASERRSGKILIRADQIAILTSKPVLCPHALNPLRHTRDCTMTIQPNFSGTPSLYLQVCNGSHDCPFRIPIPGSVDELAYVYGSYGFFSLGKSLDRATHNAGECEALESSYTRGDFRYGTRLHPAHDSSTPPLLLAWDLAVNPNGQNLANQHQHFVGTATGFTIRNLHSTRGISLRVWELLRRSAVSCSVCLCMYSMDGYQDHLDQKGICRNWFSPRLATPLIQKTDNITPDMVWDVVDEQNAASEEWWDKTAPTRAALLEWNSRIGINKDVWAVVSTMGVLCRECSRIRPSTQLQFYVYRIRFSVIWQVVLLDPDPFRQELRRTRPSFNLGAFLRTCSQGGLLGPKMVHATPFLGSPIVDHFHENVFNLDSPASSSSSSPIPHTSPDDSESALNDFSPHSSHFLPMYDLSEDIRHSSILSLSDPPSSPTLFTGFVPIAGTTDLSPPAHTFPYGLLPAGPPVDTFSDLRVGIFPFGAEPSGTDKELHGVDEHSLANFLQPSSTTGESLDDDSIPSSNDSLVHSVSIHTSPQQPTSDFELFSATSVTEQHPNHGDLELLAAAGIHGHVSSKTIGSMAHAEGNLTPSYDVSLDSSNRAWSFVRSQQNRRRPDEVDRKYKCNWSHCKKSYGSLNHLNTHVLRQKHGPKRSPDGASSFIKLVYGLMTNF